MYRYDESTQYYLRATWDEERQTRTLGLLVFDQRKMTLPLGGRSRHRQRRARLAAGGPVRAARFWWSSEATWQPIGPELDAGKISDDYGNWASPGLSLEWLVRTSSDRSSPPILFVHLRSGSLEIYHGMSRFTCDGEFSIAGLVGVAEDPSSLPSTRQGPLRTGFCGPSGNS